MPPRSPKPTDPPSPEGAVPETPAEPAPDAQPPDAAAPDLEATRAAVAASDGVVRGLLVEREGLVRAKKTARIEQVDEQLRLRGYPVAPTEGTK
jgi:hypothetical protein